MDNFTQLLKTVAPMIGSALGGPFGGIAASFIADKLGIESKTVDAVTKALSAGSLTPEQVASIKLAEMDMVKFMADNDIKREQLAVENTEGARRMQTSVKSIIPGVLAIIIVVGFFGILIAMMLGYLKAAEQQPLLILLGALAAAFGAVMNFYFGSSQGSKDKNDLLANSTPAR
jgi:hypothetical protein